MTNQTPIGYVRWFYPHVKRIWKGDLVGVNLGSEPPQFGVLLGAKNSKLRVRIEGKKSTWLVHPHDVG